MRANSEDGMRGGGARARRWDLVGAVAAAGSAHLFDKRIADGLRDLLVAAELIKGVHRLIQGGCASGGQGTGHGYARQDLTDRGEGGHPH